MNRKIETIQTGMFVKLTWVWGEAMGVTKNYLKNYNYMPQDSTVTTYQLQKYFSEKA